MIEPCAFSPQAKNSHGRQMDMTSAESGCYIINEERMSEEGYHLR
jgi:hypothetical protein